MMILSQVKVELYVMAHYWKLKFDDEHLWSQISISSSAPSHTILLFHLTKYHHVTRMGALDAMKHGHVSSEYVLKRHEADSAALRWITQVNR